MTELLINIDVPDIEKAISFYTTALPFRLGRRFDFECVELLGLSSPVYLLKKDAGTIPFPGGRVVRTYYRHWSPLHMDFVVDNIGEARKKLLEAGAVEEVPLKQEKYGLIAMFRDPFGHGLCLIQFTGRGYDALIDS